MKLLSSRWPWFIPPLTSLLYFLPSTIRGEYVFSADTTNWTYVLRRWQAENALKGISTLWNDGLFSGFYQAGSPGLGLYSPFNLFYFFIHSYFAHQLSCLFLIALSGLGMMLLVKVLTDSTPAAVFSGVVYGLSGSLLSSVHNYGYFSGACVYPWALWAYFRWKSDPNIRRAALVPLLFSWVTYEGDPIGMVCLIATVSVDAIFSWKKSTKQARLTWPLMLLATFGFCALAWMPAWEAMAETARAGKLAWEDTIFFSMSPVELLHALVPGYWGYFYDHTFRGTQYSNGYLNQRFWFDSIYVGVATLPCVIIALEKREKLPRVLGVVAGVFLLLAFGKYFPLHALLYKWFPLYGKIRFPARFFAFVNVLLVLLAGIGFKELFSSKTQSRWRFVLAGLIILSLTAAAIEILAKHYSFQMYKGLSVAVLCALAFRIKKEKWGAVFLIGLAAIDLLSSSPPLSTAPAAAFEKNSELSRYLTPRFNPRFRIVRDGLLDSRSGTPPRRDTLAHNWGVLEEMRYVFGYDPTAPARLEPLQGPGLFLEMPIWSRIFGFEYILTTINPINVHLKQWFERGGLEYAGFLKDRNLIILRRKFPAAPVEFFSSWKMVHSSEEALQEVRKRAGDKEPAVLESGEVLWRGKKIAWDSSGLTTWRLKLSEISNVSPAGNPEISIMTDRPGELGFQFSVSSPALLILRERFHSGWRAFIDDKEVPIVRADYYSRAVIVAPNQHQLLLRFEPTSFIWGAVISGLTLAFLLSMVFLCAFRCRRIYC